MTYRYSMFAAVLLLSATTALASDVTTTDQARAQPVRVAAGASSSVTAARAPTSTDEARALSARPLPSDASPTALTFTGSPASTDQARALAAGGARATVPAVERKTAMACGQSCGCKHG